MNYLKFIRVTSLIISLSIFLFGCGGGSGGRTQTGITGVTQKGDFLKDSQISFARFSKNGESSTERLDSLITDNRGSFAVNLPWSDWTKITVAGIFYNEFLGSNSTVALSLNSIANINNLTNNTNVNIFTHLVAARTEYLVEHGGSLDISNKQALSEIKSLLGLMETKIGRLDLTKNSHPDNAILLLFSSGFLSTNDQTMFATALDNLTMDFADNGLLDGVSASNFRSIANYSGQKNVFIPIYNNLISKGYSNPPNRSDLDELPAWINKNPVAIIEGSATGKTITVGEKVTLRGTGSDIDGEITSYLWSENDVTKGSNRIIELSGLSVGEHFIQLTVTDNEGASSYALIKVTVNSSSNKAPTPNAGSDKTIIVGESVTLNGSATDTDGTVVSWSWKKNGEIKKTGSGSTISPFVINNLPVGQHVYTLYVTDNHGAVASDSVVIIVNAVGNIPPVANAGSDKTINFGDSVTLNGSGSDEDGIIVSWAWKEDGIVKKSGNGASIPSYIINSLSVGQHLFSLSVTDNKGATSIDYVSITVNSQNNQAPVANAGSDKTINFGDSVTLNGSGSDEDGIIVSWSWKESGITLKNGSGSTVLPLIINNLSVGSHRFTLTVTDNEGANSTDVVYVTVNSFGNKLPVVDAGSDKTVNFGQSVTLFGSGSDTDGTITSWRWKKNGEILKSGSGSNILPLVQNNLTVGEHWFVLSVTDDKGAIATDKVKVTVKPVTNQAPIANAGSDKNIDLGDDITLNGTAYDPDGTIVSWKWKKGSVVLSSGAGSSISPYNISNLTIGEHTFTLEVTDNDNAVGTDDVTITVLDTSANQPPTANAGENKVIVELQALTITAQGTDSDGSISSYEWKEGASTISNNQTLALKGLSPGTHNLTLIVTDNEGATGSDDVTVIVKPLSVNLNNQTICRTKYGFNIQVIYSLSGDKTGSGNSELNLYSNPGCTGTRSDPTALGLSRYAPASYVIISVSAAGTSGKMTVTSQGKSSTRNITISSDGTVTAIN